MGDTVQTFEASWDEGVLRLSGELDVAQADGLLGVFRAELDGQRQLIVDLSDLAFIDSMGVRTLLRIASEARQPVVLRSPRENVRRVFALVRLDLAPNLTVE